MFASLKEFRWLFLSVGLVVTLCLYRVTYVLATERAHLGVLSVTQLLRQALPAKHAQGVIAGSARENLVGAYAARIVAGLYAFEAMQ